MIEIKPPLIRARLGTSGDRFRWSKPKGRAECSGQVRRVGEARIHGGGPDQFSGSALARGVLGSAMMASITGGEMLVNTLTGNRKLLDIDKLSSARLFNASAIAGFYAS